MHQFIIWLDSSTYNDKDKNEKTVGFIPNFKKLNSFGEYIFDQVFEQAYYQIGADYFPKFLSAIPFTPVSRLKFIYSKKTLKNKKCSRVLKTFFKTKKSRHFMQIL